MEQDYDLIVRNARLETELKSVKEQLSQANNANLYLLNQRSGESKSKHRDSTETERQLQRLRRQNVLLRKQLRVTERVVSRFNCQFNTLTLLKRLLRKNVDGPALSSRMQDKRSSYTSRDFTESGDSTQVDLLSYDDWTENSPGLQASLTDVSPYNAVNPDNSQGELEDFLSPAFERMQQYESGLRISTTSDHIEDPEQARSGPSELKTLQSRSGFHSERLGGSNIWIQTSPFKDFCNIPDYRGRVRLTRTPLRFLDHEHNRLMGAACFIECMTSEERQQHWIEYAFKNPRHGAEEWKTYYETVIRPKYTRRLQLDPSETSGLSPPDFGQTEEASHGEPTEVTERHSVVASANSISPVILVGEGDHQRVSSAPEDLKLTEAVERLCFMVNKEFTAPRLKVATGHADTYTQIMHSYHHDPMLTQGSPLETEDLFYTPDDPANHRRSVLVLNVKDLTDLNNLLKRLKVARGGLLSAAVYRTAQMKTLPPLEFNTALLTFMTHKSATGFVEAVKGQTPYLESSGDDKQQSRVRALLIKTAARPMPPFLMHKSAIPGIEEAPVPSNTLYLRGLPSQIIETLPAQAVVQNMMSQGVMFTSLLHAEYENDGSMIFQFATILDAMRAYPEIYWKLVYDNELSIGYLTGLSDIERRESSTDSPGGEMAANSDGITEEATTRAAEQHESVQIVTIQSPDESRLLISL